MSQYLAHTPARTLVLFAGWMDFHMYMFVLGRGFSFGVYFAV